MKAAVTFFVVTVFTTLFLESSTASVLESVGITGSGLLENVLQNLGNTGSGLRDVLQNVGINATGRLDNVMSIAKTPVKQCVRNIIACKNELLESLVKAANESMKKAKGAEVPTITKVWDWCVNQVKPQLDDLHADTLAAVDSGTKEDLGNVIARLIATIKQRLPQIVQNIALLTVTPGKQASSFLVSYSDTTIPIAALAVVELQCLNILYFTATQ